MTSSKVVYVVDHSCWLVFLVSIFCLHFSVYLLTAAFDWQFFSPSSVTFSWSNLSITASRSPWYLNDYNSSTLVSWPQLLLIFLLNECVVAILDASSLFELYPWALSVTSVVISSMSSISPVTFWTFFKSLHDLLLCPLSLVLLVVHHFRMHPLVTNALWPSAFCSLSLFSIAAPVLACCHTYLAFGYNLFLASLEVLSEYLQPIYSFKFIKLHSYNSLATAYGNWKFIKWSVRYNIFTQIPIVQ